MRSPASERPWISSSGCFIVTEVDLELGVEKQAAAKPAESTGR
jgi:hypothetical protein